MIKVSLLLPLCQKCASCVGNISPFVAQGLDGTEIAFMNLLVISLEESKVGGLVFPVVFTFLPACVFPYISSVEYTLVLIKA